MRPATLLPAGLVLAATLLVAPPAASAQAASVVIRGLVVHAENGRPDAGVRVEAPDSGAAPVLTGADGRYALTVPRGTHRLVVTPDRCSIGATRPVAAPADATADFRLVTKTDRYGYGCTSLTRRWVAVTTPVVLSTQQPGEGVGLLALPFAFPFHGRTYRQVHVLRGGGLTFVAPFSYLASGLIPDPLTPNAAIYALGSDLRMATASSITSGAFTDRVVVSFNRIQVGITTRRVSFQVHLWNDGNIDLLYGDLAGLAGTPVTIGLENLAGTDAVTFANNEPVAPSLTAWRFRRLASTVLTGVVRNANDALPVSGARVTADPGGRSVTTGPDGRYRLNVIPGRYAVGATASGHAGASSAVDARTGTTIEVAALDLPAPAVAVTPGFVELGVDGQFHGAGSITVTNHGTRTLHWELFKRGFGPVRPQAVPRPASPYTSIAARRVDRYPSVGEGGVPVPDIEEAGLWLSVQTGPYELAPGATTVISVSALYRFVAVGHNWGELRLETDDPHQPTVRVPVHFFFAGPAWGGGGARG